jgi:hypothetical protein
LEKSPGIEKDLYRFGTGEDRKPTNDRACQEMWLAGNVSVCEWERGRPAR